MRRFLLLALAIAGCDAPPPPAEIQRHRCVTIPTGMVECSVVEPAEPPPGPR